MDKKTKQVICTNFTNGKRHDFRLFKESIFGIHPSIKVLGDTAYRGIHKIHLNTELPKRRVKKNPLTREDRLNNQRLATIRVGVENIIGLLKRFKIISDRYRNRRKRFGLRFNLIVGVYNGELGM